jgi:N4-(beta-N-acetylglucosaminyl)-L-asparaginase
MTNPPIPRRDFLTFAAGGLAALSAGAYARGDEPKPVISPRTSPMGGGFPIKAISSHNGLEATKRAVQMMSQGADTLEAVVAGVTLVEDDAEDTSVGYGGLPNENGVVELDAAVMHGPSHRAGAVASLQNVRHAAQVAMKVLYETDHVLLVGPGALAFARAEGFQEENLLTEKARKIWLYWKQTNSNRDDWLPPDPKTLDPAVIKFFKLGVNPAHPGGKVSHKTGRFGPDYERPTGTIHCAGLNAAGEMSCVTTTSGLAFKIPGRVGDSPIIGAGLYVDNEVGSCGSTGRGEANLQNMCCFAGVELMRQGASPEEAGMEVLKRVAKKTSEKHLLDEQGRPNFGLKFYLMNNKGAHAGVSMWGPADFAVTDAQGTRHEKCRALYEKGT